MNPLGYVLILYTVGGQPLALDTYDTKAQCMQALNESASVWNNLLGTCVPRPGEFTRNQPKLKEH